MNTGDERRRVTMNTTTDTTSRFEELDYRENDGIEVSLLWSRIDDRLSVFVVDGKSDEQFELHVEGHEAMEVFRHPFAYAAGRASREVAPLRVV